MSGYQLIGSTRCRVCFTNLDVQRERTLAGFRGRCINPDCRQVGQDVGVRPVSPMAYTVPRLTILAWRERT